jgi:diguanylate cyclase (GGDEF)-like protein
VALPAVLSRRDLVLFGLLVIVAVPNIVAMQFGKGATLFYWLLGFVIFLMPCAFVYGWLARQAPARVPMFVWILRFIDERWRSFLLFLLWWAGVLGVFAVLGMCVSLIQPLLPVNPQDFTVQSLLFAALLVLGTMLICLPLRLLRCVWNISVLFYLAFFSLLGLAALRGVMSSHAQPGVFPQRVPGHLPAPFSWSLLGLVLTALMGLNLIFFFDGEMRGPEPYLRRSSRYLWWICLLVMLVQGSATVALQAIEPTALAVQRDSPVQAIYLMLGPTTALVARVLLVLADVGMALAYLLMLVRALLLGTRLGYLPASMARLNRFGVPHRAIFFQSLLIAMGSCVFFIILPLLLKTFAPGLLFSTLTTDDQFCLFVSVGNSLLALFTALLFIFAFWLFMKKRHRMCEMRSDRWLVPIMTIWGLVASVICSLAPLTPEWPGLFLSRNQWFSQVLLGLACSLLLAWLISEYPRRSVLLREQRHLLRREKMLRAELQRSYASECDLHTRLRAAYDELNHLYQEQEQTAITDSVTGLPNHRTCMQRLDEEIERCRRESGSCLILFVDLDHFKAINDTWGHQAGDAILYAVGQRLRGCLGLQDFVGRYGGEEFALVLSGATLLEASERADALLQAIHTGSYEWCGTGKEAVTVPVTASIGVAAYGTHGTQREELLEQADQAMYQAKLRGRDCACIADIHAPVQERAPVPVALMSQGWRWQEDEPFIDEVEHNQLSAQTLRAMMALVHARDHTTHTHSFRLQYLAEEVGRRLEASREDFLQLRLGGLFHDIGKMGVPEEILNKPGPLTEYEWEIMHLHPAFGARILSEIGGGFQLLIPTVLAHHEHWDGSGYPRGLRGREIPLAARVLSVLDAYDTMVSRRPYKEPISKAVARDELCRCSGTQFDPEVVRVFLEMLDSAEGAGPTTVVRTKLIS